MSSKTIQPITGDYRSSSNQDEWIPQVDQIKSQLKHIAFIMDGNGRWANARGIDRARGHEAGAKTVDMLIGECLNLGIRHITLYAFSTENWKRPQEEINALMSLFILYVNNEKLRLVSNGVRVKLIGDRTRLTDTVRAALDDIEGSTAACDKMDLILAISYGSRDEILRAVQHIAEDARAGKFDQQTITEEYFEKYLYTYNIPDPDLLIRTSGEHRISNFLLWQLAYSEIMFLDCYWPDFSKSDLLKCVKDFLGRERRYGGVK